MPSYPSIYSCGSSSRSYLLTNPLNNATTSKLEINNRTLSENAATSIVRILRAALFPSFCGDLTL